MQFSTPSGINASTQRIALSYAEGVQHITQALDTTRGMVMSSGVEYPGRYTRWELGFINPPLEFIAVARTVSINALNPRGTVILQLIKPLLLASPAVTVIQDSLSCLKLEVLASETIFPEEYRSQQPSVVTPLRALLKEFPLIDNAFLGLYGAFGYELIFQFDAIKPAATRDGSEKLYHLYWVDDIVAVDRQKEEAYGLRLELEKDGLSTRGAATDAYAPLQAGPSTLAIQQPIRANMSDEAYIARVAQAKERMRVGDAFEVVLSRKFTAQVSGPGSVLYQKMRTLNPSPFEFYCQFGTEQLVGTSPEMFVRVSGKRIESCPISGTIRRGKNAMEDEVRIRALLNSYKDEVELTMCTDVDRNDKSRICVPGSVKLLARRTIERYVGLFHTVDHVEGQLRTEFDGLDGFLSHMWAVTLTGAPKKQAVQIIENLERESRHWYGGAVGALAFNGDVNSCITIRTLHLQNGVADYRVGASIVWDSVPAEEAEETYTKAMPLYKVLGLNEATSMTETQLPALGAGYKAVMIDNEDSFVHTLADYFRQYGMQVVTYRAGTPLSKILAEHPDLVIHSPGPGFPQDFKVAETMLEIAKLNIPQFGVCLGLQGMVEAFGGRLKLIGTPRHGKTWTLQHTGSHIMQNIPQACVVGAYHSIIADRAHFPDCLEILAENEQGDVMAIKHKTLAISAVQFHPESILSMEQNVGMQIIGNVINLLHKRDN